MFTTIRDDHEGGVLVGEQATNFQRVSRRAPFNHVRDGQLRGQIGRACHFARRESPAGLSSSSAVVP